MLKQLKQNKISAKQLFQSCMANFDKLNDIINAYTHIFPVQKLDSIVGKCDANRKSNVSRPLEGLTVGVKDNFCVKGYATTAGSKMLENFIAPYDATIVKMLKTSGAIVTGKTNMDEFGMGSYNVHSYFGPVKNPLDVKRCAGGSSGGSAAAVASGMCAVAIGSDTGGSIRLPAAYCGIIGIKPAYGHLSRHGLIPYANSLDTPGVLCKHVSDGMEVLRCIDGQDQNDTTSMPSSREMDTGKEFAACLENQLELHGITIGIPKEYNVKELPDDIRNTWERGIEYLDSRGANIVSISLPAVKQSLSAYYIIALAEAASNLAKYDGVRYGFRDTNDPPGGNYTHTRSNGFGSAVKERIMMGNLVLGAGSRYLYEQASRTRGILVNEFNHVFENQCDIILSPTACNIAPLIEDVVGHKDNAVKLDPTLEYVDDVFTIPASLAGIPSFAVPVYHQDAATELPHSLQVMGKAINEFNSKKGNYNVGGGIGEKQLKVALALEAWGSN